jgi:anaerobic ribonucleoside-triphosphate reductase activating protein
MTLRLHAFLARSRANGPGWRSVVWVQGCSLGCPGCFNPQTHDREAGEAAEVAALMQRILAAGTEGLTVSGGEPLQQAEAVVALLEEARAAGLSTLLFTGLTWEEVRRLPLAPRILRCVDVLLAGRYVAAQRVAHGLLGSANQTVHLLSQRHTLEEISATPDAEAIILPDGQVVFSGISQASAAYPLTRDQCFTEREVPQMGLRQNRADRLHEP